jgi:hypothetical protein
VYRRILAVAGEGDGSMPALAEQFHGQLLVHVVVFHQQNARTLECGHRFMALSTRFYAARFGNALVQGLTYGFEQRRGSDWLGQHDCQRHAMLLTARNHALLRGHKP